MKQRKQFNNETLAEAMSILQVVSPTDEHYQAHWYNEGLGLQIKTAQENYLHRFKTALRDCKAKPEINELIRTHGSTPEWPPYIKPYEDDAALKDANVEFWTNGIGGLIRRDWLAMFQKFINFLNALQ